MNVHPFTPCSLLVLALLGSGCGTSSRRDLVVSSRAATPQEAAVPTVAVSPAVPALTTGVPVYRPPVVVEVGARPYVNASGDLILPGRRFTVLDPGGWNPAVLDAPAKAYVPFSNERRGAGTAVGGYPGREPAGGGGTTSGAREGSWLEGVPWGRVLPTGIIDPAAEAEAAALAEKASEPSVPVWSATLGWLVVPSDLLAQEASR